MKEAGISLIELIIALLLASLLTIMLLQQYVLVKRHYLMAQAELNQSSELLWISELLRNAIRNAGFTPCANINQLQGIDQRSKNPLPPALSVSRDLNIGRMSSNYHPIIQQQAQQVTVQNSAFVAGQVVMIADCFHAEIQVVAGVSGQVLHFKNPLAYHYNAPAYVGEWLEERFYMKENTALFYRQQHSEELSNLITAMTLQYQAPLVTLNLSLKDGLTLLLKTRVRTV